ncbi:hypothetical protein HCC61_21190 [Streptomyces sp. HNM0575]|uniref:hypothetical protein n=1 Tax=Streptomyces sp. HNM0575 TaxID=2716338 RepID=UPI00145EC77B|nr:hypothetical protein [Streptomyces sp. HNM0575]NLU75153.1 hypothetical protein [Streptomyces sp. HNM0575]
MSAREQGPPVLWLGGPPAAGKTTVARLIARQHGLRWYNGEAHTWEHRDRALAAGHTWAVRWEALPRAERWTGPTARLLAMSLHHERGAMIADDLRALPASPATIAEGTPVTPPVAGDRERALWLLPTPDVQRERLLSRGMSPRDGAFRLYRSLLTEIENQVEAYGARSLRVDGSRSAAETAAEVEAAFAGALAEGPSAATAAERRELLRYGNRALVSQHEQFFARPWAPPPPPDAALVFACECGEKGCTEDVELPFAGFPRPPEPGSAPVLAPGHEAPVWPGGPAGSAPVDRPGPARPVSSPD